VGTYIPPGPGDVRAPCPALNTLANHGYLNRNGQGIDQDQVSTALQQQLGVTESAAQEIVGIAFSKLATNGLIDLDVLATHNVIEHDASMSRLDAYISDGHQNDFNPDRFSTLLSFSSDGQVLTQDDVVSARIYFLNDSKTNNPEFSLPLELEGNLLAETAIFLNVLGRNGEISLEDASSFFVDGRFPDSYQPPNSYGLLQLVPETIAIKAAMMKQQALSWLDQYL